MRQPTDKTETNPMAVLAAAALAEHYGLAGQLQALPGEHDANFKVTTPDGRRFLFKIHAPNLAPVESELQVEALRHVEKHAPDLPMQRVLPGKSDAVLPELHTAGGMRRLRLTTWLDGEVWAKCPVRGKSSAASLGKVLGRLDRSLAGFRHPAARRRYQWDLAQAADQLAYVPLIDRVEKREAVTAVLQRFAAELAPRLADRPRQVIHNDANDYNILLDADGAVTGLLDFGDMVESWGVCEVAVACAYAMIGANDPLGAILPLIAAYHDENPLDEIEADLLFDLIMTRYAISISIAAKQIRENPTNQYLLISQDDVWGGLRRLLSENRRISIMRIRAACRYDAVPTRREVESWLERRAQAFGPVLQRDLTRKGLVVLDIGKDGPNAAAISALENDAALAGWMDGVLAEAGDKVVVGRYGEDRSVYRSAAFETADPAERRTIHIGIDLFAPADDPVLAPLEGTVADIGHNVVPYGFGSIVILEHATDRGVKFWTLYGHLSAKSLAGLKIGQRLGVGEVIGKLGRHEENGEWPPHLHFQIMTDLCGWKADEVIGVAARSQWDVWGSVCPSPNVILGLPVNCSAVVARDADWLRRERHYMLGRSLSLAYAEPLKIVRGEGVHLIDEAGRRFLDMVNNVCHVGHCHPRVVEAAQRQMPVLNTNSRYLHDNLVEYSRRLTATLPPELSVVFMVNSGSEANDLALRLARAYTGHTDVITVDHAYHGHLTSLIDISPYKFAGKGGEGRKSHVWVAEMPDLYRGRFRYDMTDAGPRYAEKIATLIRDMGGVGRKPAVFFSEGILGTGGQLTLPAGYLEAAYAHVRAASGVCVADEVQIGFGRVGAHMWAFETQGVVPDIVTMGKPIGNGHPMAAVVTRPEIAAAFANGMEYFNTFGGNPVSAAIGLAVLDVIRDERLMQNAAAIGARMAAGLRDLALRHRIIGDVRGHGLFLGVELVRDRATLEPADAELSAIIEAMKAKQILLSSEGPYHNVLKIKPPIVFSADNCDEFLEKLDVTLRELRA